MIVKCKNCGTRFNLDEALLKKEGSSVRCSLCRNIFVVIPPGYVPIEEQKTVAVNKNDLISSKKATQVEAEDQYPDLGASSEEAPEDSGMLEETIAADFPAIKGQIAPAAGEELPALDTEETAEDESEITSGAVDKPAKSHLRLILLVMVLVLVGAAIAIFFWVPELIPDSLQGLKPVDKQEITDVGVRSLEFRDVDGFFVDSEGLGNLFVIRGKITNNYSRNRSFILIKGTIKDDKGQAIKRKLAYAGNTFKVEEIESLSLDEINKAMKNSYGTAGKNFNVPPGAAIPFMIMFDNLAENLSEFAVEAVSSSPGTSG